MARANNKLGETFFPLTEKAARKFHSAKLLSTPLYLLVIKSLFTKPNADFVISNVTEFCKEWGISKSAFYRAVNTLTALGELAWEATEGVVLKPNNKVATIPRAGHRPMSGTPSHERDCDSHERDCDSHERDCDSHERDTGIYKDRVRDRSYSDQTDLTQIAPPEPGAPPPNSVCVSSSSEKPESTQVSPGASESKQTSSLTTTVSDEIKDSGVVHENDSHVHDEHPATESERWLNGEYKQPEWAVKRCGSKWIALPEFIKWYALKSSKSVDYAANCLQKAESESTTQLLWEEYQASLRPSKPLVAASVATSKKLSPEEESRQEHERRLRRLRSFANFPEKMRQRRFVPSFLSDPNFTNQIDKSEIPDWIKELMEF